MTRRTALNSALLDAEMIMEDVAFDVLVNWDHAAAAN